MDAHEFEVWQDGLPVASASSEDRAAAVREALHYAAVYSQDGPVSIYEVKRTPMEIKDAAEWLASAG